jgi:hypothetical protein
MWILAIVGIIGSISVTIIRFGWNWATLLILVPLVSTLLTMIYTHSSQFRKWIRSVKNFLNLGTFDMVFDSNFKFTEETKLVNVNKDAEKLQDLFHKCLEREGFKGNKNELVNLSFARVSGIKLYVKPHKIYFELDQSDNGGISSLYVKATGRLKYKNAEDVLERYLISIYSNLCSELKLDESKYVLKLVKNTKKKDFMKKQFVKEIKADDISSFQIRIKKPDSIITATEENIQLVTKEKAYLISSIKTILKLIN